MEVFKDIAGYEGLYQISNLGRVKSLPKRARSVGSAGYEYTIQRRERILSTSKDKFGYIRARLSRDKKQKLFLLHRLIACAFIPNPKNKRCVNHKNGVKADNRIDNLEWMSHSENSKHSFEIGLQCNKGENHPLSKLKSRDILKIRKLYSNGISSYKIHKSYYPNFSYTNIKDIIAKRTWSHI